MTHPDAQPTTVCVSADDADFMANLLTPATGQVISLQTVDREQAFDAHLDAIATCDGMLVLECRHIGEHCIPRGPTWTVPLADVVYLHIW